ncbi:probable E3 ubiquitin-protein ligase RHB1A isoform X2 [Coffea arabica]|uniref:RING-type E3 ubiquitin transferase n=1 Tax=Coffea arabica TaxID=13443 RepID=A0A6P6VZ37_COFAR
MELLYFTMWCPSVSEEHESLTSNDSVATALTAGFLVDLNLDTSIPDTFRSPPTPIPFDVVLGRPPTDSNSTGEPGNASSFETDIPVENKESDLKAEPGFLLATTKKIGNELLKSSPHLNSLTPDEEADVCPTCLEDYDAENPRIVTKCNHHFHLSCILEWMERSDTCPICDQIPVLVVVAVDNRRHWPDLFYR